MSKLRYVFDTNVLINALLFKDSKSVQAFRYALANGEYYYHLTC